MRKIFFLILLIQFFVFSSVNAQLPPDTGYNSGITLTFIQSYNPTPSRMYQRILTPVKPTPDTSEVILSALPENVQIVTQYFDFIGRPIQKIVKQASPLKKDFVSPVVYDKYGRVVSQYLPYVQQSGNTDNGKYKSTALVADSSFYRSLFPDEDVFWSKADFDASPLQRVKKVMAEGDNWTGAGIGKTISQRANTISDSVRLWTINISSEDDAPATTIMYQAGSLLVDEITDERGIKTVAYKDESGRTVLTKVQLSSSPSAGHAGWLCTYYVYDEMNALRMVIPPKAVEALLSVSWNLAGNATIRTGLCYAYYYDSKGRQIMKYIPGKGKSYIAYDLLGRVVMTQDANLRQTNQWAFIKYDGQSRPIKSGLITSALIKDSIIAQAFRSSDYPALSGTYTITSESYYDDYNWTSGTPLNNTLVTANINSTNFYTTYNASPEYAQQITESKRIRGAVTGSKKIIIGTGNYLYSLSLYDQYGRAIQVKETNYTGGTDVQTMQFDFSGKILRTHLAHQKSGANAQAHTLLTKYIYDHVGRIYLISKDMDGTGDKTIVKNLYNELGQLQTKRLGVNPGQGGGISIEDQEYSYNIRGWLSGINKDYVAMGSAYRYFGEALYYESGFGNNQLNGAIGGVQWKTKGDGIARSYQFTYDNANRLTSADFNQQNEGSTSWTKDKVDFSVTGLTYDAGSNILSMKQRGLQIGSSATIDSLAYQYFTNSNQLQKVSDGITASGRLGDFKDTTLTGDDYSYDVNGNITKDYNRKMHTTGNGAGAVYNVLDKADSLVIAGKATLYYYYDASGIKLRKQVNDYTSGTLVTKNYLYINGFVYLNDTLQYTLHEEGRVRYAKKRNSTTGALYYAFEYDFFIRDHLNNVRAVLTEGKDTSAYAATMESQDSTFVRALFSNVYDPVNTVYPKPSGFDSESGNQKVSRLNADGAVNKRTGPSLVLKVMAGDKVQINTYSYYNTPVQPPGSGPSLLNELLGVLSAGVVTNNSGGHLSSGDITGVSNTLSPGVLQFLTNDRSYDNTKPKAYLNWILFDNQFKYVGSNSGVQQVQPGSGKQALVAPLQTIAKNGYLYIYVSNESPQDVYFDDLTVKHYSGPLLQEQSYYPFGLQMAGISDKALNKLSSKNKFNGGVELEEDYGVNLYSTFYRQYDPQLGRFSGVDIRSEEQNGFSTYHFAGNNPITFNDPLGDMMTVSQGRMQKGPDGNYHVGWVNDILWNNIGFFDSPDDGGGGGGQAGGGKTYTNIMGMSSANILSQMKFGDTFGRNKSGEYGFWSRFTFKPTDRGYNEKEASGNTLSEVSVGAGKIWMHMDPNITFGLYKGSFNGNYGLPTLWNLTTSTIWFKPENNNLGPQSLAPGKYTSMRIDGVTHPKYPGKVFKVVDYIDITFGIDADKDGICIGCRIIFGDIGEGLNQAGGGGWLPSPPTGWEEIFEKAGYKPK